MSETPPEELHGLIQALSRAMDPSHDVRSAALDQLTSWSLAPAYWPSLVEVFANKSYRLGPAARDIRLQAGLQFKNGVDKWWKRGPVNGIKIEAKEAIRPRVLLMLDEPDLAIAKTVAVIVGKMAKNDFPDHWPALIPALLQNLNDGYGQIGSAPTHARLVLHRTLLFLHNITKELISIRTMRMRKAVLQHGPEIFKQIQALHLQLLNLTCSDLQNEMNAAEISYAELALLSFKILRRLTIYGFERPFVDEVPRTFITNCLVAFQNLTTHRLNLLSSAPHAANVPSFKFLTKHVVSFGKLFREIRAFDGLAYNKLGFSESLMGAYWLVVKQASQDVARNIQDGSEAPFPERLVVQALLILSVTLEEWPTDEQENFSADFARNLMEVLLLKLLPLRPQDLEKWENDAEEWMNEEEADRWEFELRPCAEHVVKLLCTTYKDVLNPVMSQMLQQVCAPGTSSFDQLLVKEGIYCAFGRSPAHLDRAVDFDKWLDSNLIPEAGATDSNGRTIRRRIAWLLGAWIGEDLLPATRAKIYQLMVHLLGSNASTDTAIRLTAARSLAKCDTWEFKRESFLPYLPSVMNEVVLLLREVEMPESRMRLNETLGVTVGLVGKAIAPFSNLLADILTELWASTDNNHFQTSILVTMTKLVVALEEASVELHPQANPVIKLSIDSTLASHVYLQEDGLELWQALLRRTQTLTPPLLDLFPMILPLIANGTDILARALAILESYLLIDAPAILQRFGPDVLASCEVLLVEDLPDVPLRSVLRAVEFAIRCAPFESWAEAMISSGCFMKLLVPLLPSRSTECQRPAQTYVKYLNTMARVMMKGGADGFLALVDTVAARADENPDRVVEAILNELFNKYDNMGQSNQRKLTALALGRLVRTQRPVVLSRLTDMIGLWNGVMAEGDYDDEEEDAQHQFPSYEASDDLVGVYGFGDENTSETKRSQALLDVDPVYTEKLNEVLSACLNDAQTLNGDAFQAQYLAAVDPLLLDELQRRLLGKLKG